MAGAHRSGGIFSRALALVALALVCSVAANLLRPDPIPWVEDWSRHIEARAMKERITLVDVEQAFRVVHSGLHLVLDARPAADFQAGHLPGALSVPYEAKEEAMAEVQMFLTPSRPILAYCSGEACDESFLLTLYLRDQGFTNVALFAGGTAAWKAAGHPLQEGR
jgi:rhodanese-related sulfurtransferase